MFKSLYAKEKAAADEFDELKGYKTNFFKGELKWTETESILLFLSEGDLTKEPVLKKMKYREIINRYYRKRQLKLNELLGLVEHIKHLRKKSG